MVNTSQPSMQLMTVGEVVRTLRNRRDLEQVVLARKCGWRDASAVSRIETDRVRPTKRTLLKLTDALADPTTTGSPDQVRGMLFLASGILPTKQEIADLAPALPGIEGWTQPAALMDFGWHVWVMNRPFGRVVAHTGEPRGRHLLDILFDPSHPLRARAPDAWETLSSHTVSLFRQTAGRYQGRRWYESLIDSLASRPGFEEIWKHPPEPSPSTISGAWEETSSTIGAWGVLMLPLATDARLWVALLVPEDDRSAAWLCADRTG